MGIREKVVAAAQSQVGVCEPSGDDVYLKWFNTATGSSLPMNASWCACFVSWCLRQGGLPTSVFGNFAQCSVALSWAKSKKIWHSRLTSHHPQAGELVLFDWDGDGKADHIGIVVQAGVNTLKTIEGNARGTASVDGVREKQYALTSRYIKGYIDIQYPDETKKDLGTMVKSVQTYLVKTYQAGIAVDGAWGPKSKTAMVHAVQQVLNETRNAGLVVDGIWGPKSSNAFPTYAMPVTGKMVALIQGCLIVHGADLEMDSEFGKLTKAAVQAFQKANGLSVDGIVGKNTIEKLLK